MNLSASATTFKPLNVGVVATYPAVVQTFGARIAHLRKDVARIKPKELARRMGVTYQQVWDWEHDKAKGVELATLMRFAPALGVTVETIIAGMNDDYDAFKRDLIRHAADQSSVATPHGGSIDEQSRALQRLQDEFDEYRAAHAAVVAAAARLVAAAAGSGHGDTVRPQSGGSRRRARHHRGRPREA